MRKMIAAVSVVIALSVFPAGAETTNCTAITAVPVTLSAPGVYCLTGNIDIKKGKGFGIRIGADNVTIDLNGFTLRNTRDANFASGIFARDKRNIVIRNGTIEGWSHAIEIDDENGRSVNHLFEEIHANFNWQAGILALGDLLTIRNNRITSTGRNDTSEPTSGIEVRKFKNVRIYENTISDMLADLSTRAISADNGSEIVIENNVIFDIMPNPISGTYGILLQSTDRAHIVGNQLVNQDNANTGIRTVSSTGVTCSDNYIDGYTTVHATCDSISGTLP